MTLQVAQQTLQQYFGYANFRPLQAEIIDRILHQKDALVLMPTGGGKSICFQIPAMVMPGVCVVVSPLISLMKDQVESLQGNGVLAAYLNSSLSFDEQKAIEEKAKSGQLKLLYVSPEKLVSESFINFLHQLKINLFAIDEAHCISSWGHDFRPEYTKLRLLKKYFPRVPMVALTATADKTTREDILKQLELNQAEVFLASFDRPNLSLKVLPGQKRIQAIFDFLQTRKNDSGIIYCLSRKSTESLAEKLRDKGFDAIHYHAGMYAPDRAKAQEDFLNDRAGIVCATVAFGMGIDKSNVRWVIHYNLPKNIESYYQEIGRAGRDGLKSDTVLFYSYGDVMLLQKFAQDSGQSEMQLAKLDRMQQYADASICRRKILLSYFGESLEGNCNNCDVCKNPPSHFDGTLITQKALSAVYRVKESIGITMLIDILRGSQRQDLAEHGYDKIKTYGVGKDISARDWRAFILQFLQLGLLEMAYNQGNNLKLTNFARSVLFEKKKVELVKLTETKKKAEKTFNPRPKSNTKLFDEELFEHLRLLRRAIAGRKGVHPDLIFSDPTLKEMAEILPLTHKKMLAVSGVGAQKLKDYGDTFIDSILEFIRIYSQRGKRVTKITTYVTLAYYKEHLDAEEIAERRNLSPTTIYSHLADLYVKGFDIDIFSYISHEELEKVIPVIKKQFGITEQLKDIYEHFDQKVPYHKLRLAMAYLKVEENQV
jgi:ATP-dependent DNA helicase RecQ